MGKTFDNENFFKLIRIIQEENRRFEKQPNLFLVVDIAFIIPDDEIEFPKGLSKWIGWKTNE